jgi:hypothetical protein
MDDERNPRVAEVPEFMDLGMSFLLPVRAKKRQQPVAGHRPASTCLKGHFLASTNHQPLPVPSVPRNSTRTST